MKFKQWRLWKNQLSVVIWNFAYGLDQKEGGEGITTKDKNKYDDLGRIKKVIWTTGESSTELKQSNKINKGFNFDFHPKKTLWFLFLTSRFNHIS